MPLTGIRKAAAKQMVAAWAAPAFHLSTGVDMTEALKVRETIAGATVTDVIIRACAAALVQVPEMNAWYEDLSTRRFAQVNIGVAVATEAGLTVPVIHDASALDLAEIAERRRDAVQRARHGALKWADVSRGTFTISNLGMRDIDSFDAILNVPQVAILAVAATRPTPIPDGERGMRWRSVAQLTLSCDHRAVDGAAGAAFLEVVKAGIEAPIARPGG
ncbi:2-oxo acid dehydrogenase subunit E2 [Herbiconiux moechotypicola]|uniref:2-oxo acid dehydrogenase subunit E2 n=1 Tax=Herbiconiux moechotypicola TaxID=637393 RepID=UPI00217EA063|nr:2-oxo acid dehydrogenase subunit E2 [Herbiconiux moechotypicola]MCS5732081.1 2-oxo acid dehydrogenase subunit E2 [Herbiconiux moechotypicola]